MLGQIKILSCIYTIFFLIFLGSIMCELYFTLKSTNHCVDCICIKIKV